MDSIVSLYYAGDVLGKLLTIETKKTNYDIIEYISKFLKCGGLNIDISKLEPKYFKLFKMALDNIKDSTLINKLECFIKKDKFLEYKDILAMMYAPAIGMTYRNDKLIKLLIHSFPAIGMALFISFALDKIDIIEWPFKLIEMMQSDFVKQHIKTEEATKELRIFNMIWNRYIELRFKDGHPIDAPSFDQLGYRFIFFNKMIEFKQEYKPILLLIETYDIILSIGKSWEKLIYFGILNSNGKFISPLLGGLFGALYGYDNVPKNFYN
jgi:hypothetical protein